MNRRVAMRRSAIVNKRGGRVRTAVSRAQAGSGSNIQMVNQRVNHKLDYGQ